jgi:uncharacterized protein (DUF433 family)
MGSKTRGIRIPEQLEREIEREAEYRGRSWSATTAELLAEAVRMRRAPGIVFADGPAGRRAVVAGTGLDVWEVIASWIAAGRSYEETRQDYPWLTDVQLRTALGYYELYPEEINTRLEKEAAWTPERVRREFSFLAPRSSRT